MTGRQLKNYRLRMKMNREALAFWLGVDPNTVFRWERGIQPVPNAVEVVLKSTPRPREGWKWMDDFVLVDGHPQNETGELPDAHPLGPDALSVKPGKGEFRIGWEKKF